VLDAGRSATATREGEGRAELAVRLLLDLAEPGAPPRTPAELQESLGRPLAEIESLLTQLADDGLIDGSLQAGFSLHTALRAIPLSRVVSAVSPDLLSIGPEGRDRVARMLRRSFRKASAERDAVLNVTLADVAGRR
jgi:DNA-binding IscR family transcriptional regulator